jgi:hypothetical protein
MFLQVQLRERRVSRLRGQFRLLRQLQHSGKGDVDCCCKEGICSLDLGGWGWNWSCNSGNTVAAVELRIRLIIILSWVYDRFFFSNVNSFEILAFVQIQP